MKIEYSETGSLHHSMMARILHNQPARGARLSPWLCIFVIVAWSWTVVLAGEPARGERIQAYEWLDTEITRQAAELMEKSARQGENQPLLFSFRAFGRQWRWQVKRNQRLLEGLPAKIRANLSHTVQLWKGRSLESPDGWLRFSLWQPEDSGMPELHGLWWDGQEFYVLAPLFRTTLDSSMPAGIDRRAIVVYRLADVVYDQPVNGAHEQDFLHAPRHLVDELRTRFKAAQETGAATQQLNVAIVADTFYQSLWGGSTTSSILNLMNNVDGIYSNQIGVAVAVSQIVTLSNNAGMTATDPITLLEQFRDWVGAGNISNPGLAHLFTSRDLDGNVKGIAWVNVLCAGALGTGVDEVVGASYETILVAHEMGHNFGADHDGDANGSCPDEPIETYIMSPSVSASYTNFSPCSVTVLENAAAAATCLVPLGPDLIFQHGFE